MSALEDYQVDRSEVYARISKGAQLTDTNRTIGLIVTFVCSAIVPLPKRSRLRAQISLQPNFFLVAIAMGSHPFPFRTRPLSPSAPMILERGK
jgi:hypothetical protein